MLLRPPGYAVVAAALLLACGERAGDPVVALTEEAGAEPDTSSAGAGVDGSHHEADGPTGLCGRCSSSDDCGDANDACVRHDGSSFCARDCEEGFGCPQGYACRELDNSRLHQCVPERECQSQSSVAPDLDDARANVLAHINTLRSAHDQAPLEASPCLDRLAQESALAYARTDEPLGKYVKECDPVWPNCSCGWTAQAEVAVAYYGLDWLSAIDAALGEEQLRGSISELDFQLVGVGFWISGDEAWIALSFG
ncbi:MAG TPA: hypothetical protein VIW29_13285 [Polyangiaceae bacterium]